MNGSNIPFLVTLWINWLYNFSTRTIVATVLPVIERELQISHGGAGSILSFYAIGYASALLSAGQLIRWLGYTKLVIYGHLGVLLLVFLSTFGKSYSHFVIVYLFLGFVAGAYLPCGIALLAERFSSDNRAKIIGFHQMAPSVAFLVIPLMVGLLLKLISWRSIILLFAFTGIPILLALVKFVGGALASTLPVTPNYGTVLKDKRVWVVGLLFGIAGICNIGIFSIAPLFLVSEKGFSVQDANQLLGISRIGGVFVPFLVGALADRLGYVTTLIPVVFVVGLFTVLMTMGYTEGSLLVFLLVQGSAAAGFFPLLFALIARTVDHSNRGTAVGIVTVFGAIFGIGLAPWILGTVADHYSFGHGIMAVGVLALISPVLLRAFR